MQAQTKIMGDATKSETNKVVPETSNVDPEHISNSRKSRKPPRRRPQQGPRRHGKECESCGYQHLENRKLCPTFGKECRKSGKRNHFALRCKSGEVKLTDLKDDKAGEMYQIQVSAERLDDSQLVTLRLESGNFVHFQPDTGAQCNVLPLHIYKASKDDKLEKVNCSQASLVACGGSKIKVADRVSVRAWRNDKSSPLDCCLIYNEEIHPILGFK